MQKTKLGITVGLLGAALYFSGLFGGYVITIILAGYVLFFEENAWLKKAAVKSVALMMLFSFIGTAIDLIPDFIGFINSIFNVFGSYFYLEVVVNILNVVLSALSLVKVVVFLILGMKALSQSTLTLPVIDKLINKHMG